MNSEQRQRRLAARIIAARAIAGLRQEDLAERVGVSSTTIKSWEIGRHAVSGQYYFALAAAFGIDVAKLLEGLDQESYDDEEWRLDIEYATLDPRLKERVIREVMSEQNQRVDRSRDHVAVSLRAPAYAMA